MIKYISKISIRYANGPRFSCDEHLWEINIKPENDKDS